MVRHNGCSPSPVRAGNWTSTARWRSFRNMSVAANEQVVRRFFSEVYEQGQADLLPALVNDDYRDYGHTPPGEGLQGARDDLAALSASFSDRRFAIDEILSDDDRVMVRWTGTMRHTGSLQGEAPTGREVTMTGISVYELRDGRISATRNAQDVMGLVRQIGTPPAA